MLIKRYNYEREGNDAWLKDYITIYLNDIDGLYISHKKRCSGWNGEINENNTLILDEYDLDKSQKSLNEYLYEHNLEDGIVIKLNEIIPTNWLIK
ncbi:hypothetical protein M0Q97_02575 [Candidatus Dojkabacteria bacterium]|jgi:hypothetical protein|nr:hypothetical protein [Candidatus Dojkabacteria bacterium]